MVKAPSNHGELLVETHRDHDASFSPQTIRKRERMLAEGTVRKEAAESELDNLENKWGEQYPIIIRS